MSFIGPAVFIAENSNAEELRNQRNDDNNGHKVYLTTLENLFVGKAESELSKTNFSSGIQKEGNPFRYSRAN